MPGLSYNYLIVVSGVIARIAQKMTARFGISSNSCTGFDSTGMCGAIMAAEAEQGGSVSRICSIYICRQSLHLPRFIFQIWPFAGCADWRKKDEKTDCAVSRGGGIFFPFADFGAKTAVSCPVLTRALKGGQSGFGWTLCRVRKGSAPSGRFFKGFKKTPGGMCRPAFSKLRGAIPAAGASCPGVPPLRHPVFPAARHRRRVRPSVRVPSSAP